MKTLTDKIALVTGGASGIGFESATLFASEGAMVVVDDINDQEGDKAVSAIREVGGVAVYQRADVSSASDCEAMIRSAEDTYGGFDILFNNAGIMDCGDDNAMVTDEDV